MAKYLLFEIANDSEKPEILHITLVAATQMSFDISHAGRDYQKVIQDVCHVAPHMMSYDADLMEAFDDAFRTQPKAADKLVIANFMKNYRDAMSNVDIDFLEEE